ncbi:MAG: HEAT repeat domain-containing protein [Erysipelotrichia bacterium]|nr:HEAT repeat domain-containing protein [Erysipelotrichia bacterium]
MDDYSTNLNNLNSDDSEKQIAGLAFFAACDETMLSDEAVGRLVKLAESAPKHISNIAASIISRSLSSKEHKVVAAPLMYKLQNAPSNEISIRELDWATKLNNPAFKKALEVYLERCDEPRHISWLVKNLPKAYPDLTMLPLLTSFLTYGDDRIVGNTIEGLENINDPAVVSIFAQMLGHASARVRSMAAEALSRVHHEKASKALAAMLQRHKDPGTIKSACYAIRQMQDSDLTELLIPLLHYPETRDEAAQTIAHLSLQKINALFFHKAIRNSHDIQKLLASSVIDLLQKSFVSEK